MVLKIAYLYLLFLSFGCLVLLPLVRLREVGQGFYRFFGFTCVALQVLALGTFIWAGKDWESAYLLSSWALGGFLFFTLAFTVSLRAQSPTLLWSLFGLAGAWGLAAACLLPWLPGGNPWFLAVHALSSSLVLGFGILAMMLGHWYLVIPKLSIEPLKRYSAGYILLSLWKAAELSLAWMLFVGKDMNLPLTEGGRLLAGDMVFALFRVTWGLAAPLGLAYWIWGTVKIRSTQSATGILYAAMVATLIGEALGLYLTLGTGVPF